MSTETQKVRARAKALSDAAEVLRESFGDLIDSMESGDGPDVRLGTVLGVPDDMEDVRLCPWELFLLLEAMAEKYSEEVLAPAEALSFAAGAP